MALQELILPTLGMATLIQRLMAMLGLMGRQGYGADFGSSHGGYFTTGYAGRPAPGKLMRGRRGRGRQY